MNWRGAKVVITGADGFIGSHLTEMLAANGAAVTALAQYNSFDAAGWLDEIPASVRLNTRVVRGDIRDAKFVHDLVAGHDVVFHLAALVAIPFSYDAPSSYVATNVQGTLNVLEAARAAGIRRVVHTSTSEVYGTAQTTPIREDHPLVGQSPYSASKIGADMLAVAFHRSFGLPVVLLRPFNTFGPRQSERAVIPTIIRQALDPRCDAIRLGDLTPKRDFNFVGDIAAAFMAVADVSEEGLGEVYNAGTGRMVSVGDVVEAVRALTGTEKTVAVEMLRTRPPASEVMALVADSTRLNRATGWSPFVSLEEGLRQTIAWWAGRLDRVRTGSSYMV
jgi:NAD dependent epimerase/dehydratase